MSSIVALRVAAYDQAQEQAKFSPVSSAAGGEATSTSSSSSTTNTRTWSPKSFKASGMENRSGGHVESDCQVVHKLVAFNGCEPRQEELLGTHVLFVEAADDLSVTSYCSHPSQKDASIEEATEAEDGECSEAALMAAIAVATAKKGEETSCSVFLVTAAAEAVATASAEQIDEECKVDREETLQESDKAKVFERIEQHFNIADKNATGVKTGKDFNVAQVLQDLERVIFFTDVIDRNAPPPSVGDKALMSPSIAFSAGLDLWLGDTVKEVTNSIYKSSLDVYNELERTCKEVERTLLFTDVPDIPECPPPVPQSARKTAGVSAQDMSPGKVPSSENDLNFSLPTTEGAPSTSTGLPPKGTGAYPSRARSKLESVVKDERPRTFRASNVTPQLELSRVLKTLEKKLLFTDLTDEPLKCNDDRTPTMPFIPTMSCGLSGQAVNSSLGACRSEVGRALFFTDLEDLQRRQKEMQTAKTSLMDMVLSDDQSEVGKSYDLQQQWQARMELDGQLYQRQLAGFDVGNSQIQNSSKGKNEIAFAGLPAEITPVAHLSSQMEPLGTTYASEADESDIAAPAVVEISSDRCSWNERSIPRESTAGNALLGSRNGSESERIQTATESSEPEPDVVAYFELESQDEPTLPERSLGELEPEMPQKVNQPIQDPTSPEIKADSSSANSVSLLVDEVRGQKSDKYNIAWGAHTDGGARPSDASALDAAVKIAGQAEKSWTSQDEQNLACIMDSMKSEDSHEVAVKALAVVLATVEDIRPDPSHEDGAQYRWQVCASSTADTYATATDHQNEGCSVDPSDESAIKSTEYCECPQLGKEATTKEVLMLSDRDTKIVPSTETFDALLAEMKELETAINLDLQRAHTVLNKPVQETDSL